MAHSHIPHPKKNAADPMPWVIIAISVLPVVAVAAYFFGVFR